MLWDALILVGIILTGVLIEWLVVGWLHFNRRTATVVAMTVVVLIAFQVWNQPRDSVGMTLPNDMPLRSALKLIAQARGATIEFAPECDAAMRDAVVVRGPMTAADLKQLLELPQYRLANDRTEPRYGVVAWAEKGFYEIRC